MKKRILTLLLSALCASLIVTAQKQVTKADGKPLTTASINRTIRQLMDTAEVTGLALGIINNNRVVYTQSYGYKNKAKQQWNDTATSFYAASLAKPLFAFLVMQLVEEKRISLDQPLYTYLPKPLPGYEAYKDLAGDDRWKLITARHCLTHTTGFPNWRELNPRNNRKLAIFFTPGERYAYSGEGLYLLQMVIETITGKHLEVLAQEKVFQPFHMRNTSFLWQPSFDQNCAVGHTMNEDTIPNTKSIHENAAGSMQTTIADYTRFVAAFLQGKGLSLQEKTNMLTPQVSIHSQRQFPSLDTATTTEYNNIQLSYGLGWGLFTTPYGRAFFKEGHGDGWVHYLIGFPGSGNAVIIMTNSANGESIFTELTKYLTGVTIPWQWEGYTPYRGTVKLPQSTLQQLTGVYKGKLTAIISLVNGQLKVEAPGVGLPKTNLYAVNDHHFFLKVMETELEFVKDTKGNITKAILNDEGEHYELLKDR